MSVWTRVHVSILAVRGTFTKRSLGRTCHLDKNISSEEYYEKWKKCNVPKGSEGSLFVKITKIHGGIYDVITIHGDLRDYWDLEGIINYLDRICYGKCLESALGEVNINGKKVLLKLNNRWKISNLEGKIFKKKIEDIQLLPQDRDSIFSDFDLEITKKFGQDFPITVYFEKGKCYLLSGLKTLEKLKIIGENFVHCNKLKG